MPVTPMRTSGTVRAILIDVAKRAVHMDMRSTPVSRSIIHTNIGIPNANIRR